MEYLLIGGGLISLAAITWGKKYISVLSYIYKTANQSISPAVHVVGDIYSVSYTRNNRVHQLYFPIRSGLVESMRGFDLYMTEPDKVFVQEPGVPFLIVPDDIGPHKKLSLYSEDEDIPISFTGTTSPMIFFNNK